MNFPQIKHFFYNYNQFQSPLGKSGEQEVPKKHQSLVNFNYQLKQKKSVEAKRSAYTAAQQNDLQEAGGERNPPSHLARPDHSRQNSSINQQQGADTGHDNSCQPPSDLAQSRFSPG